MSLVSIAIFGAGYVLGTKAGRERYEQIVKAAQNASQRLEEYSAGGSGSQHRQTGAVDTPDARSGRH